MTDMLLGRTDQDAVRAIIAAEPVLGGSLMAGSTMDHLARLIPSDAIGLAVLDATGSTVDEAGLPHHGDLDGLPLPGPAVGVRTLDGIPAGAGSSTRRGVAVLSLGVRNGPDHVVTLWFVRRTKAFSGRDRALLTLLAPALERLLRERPLSTLPPSLTAQERRVLQELAHGLSNAEIAERLFVAPCTVRKHLENAYRKLGVTNRLAAVHAVEHGGTTGSGIRDRMERADSFA